MRHLIYYLLLLLLAFFWYRYGQKLLREGPRDENDELVKGPLGPVGLFMSAGIACTLFFFMLRALIRREVPCVGKGCQAQLYTLAANAADYWANMFFLLWMVLGLGYAVYVTLRIWFRS
ncbi:hypothetical protein [Variovorax gossypii]